MAFEITAIAGGRTALATSSGTITSADRIAHRDATIQFCKENNIRNVIVDTRRQVCRSSTMEVFDFGSASVEAIGDLRVAFLPAEDDRDIVFIDAVAGNRGAVVRVCRSMKEAEAWLESLEREPVPPPPLSL
jgi:hypothetical protein